MNKPKTIAMSPVKSGQIAEIGIGAETRTPHTTIDTEEEEFQYANNGQVSRTSLPIWASGRKE